MIWLKRLILRALLLALWLFGSLALTAKADERNFDSFLPKFKLLYKMYHMGDSLPKDQIDRIAMRIWNGSGHNWLMASTTACQGICESHYQLSQNKHLKYRGHIGMHLNTITVEGIRVGMIKKTPHDKKWLLKTCRQDTSIADGLSASRLVFLTDHYGSRRIAIFQYVKGYGWKHKSRNLKAVMVYWQTVEGLRVKFFN